MVSKQQARLCVLERICSHESSIAQDARVCEHFSVRLVHCRVTRIMQRGARPHKLGLCLLACNAFRHTKAYLA
jgi:hypothetical protein